MVQFDVSNVQLAHASVPPENPCETHVSPARSLPSQLSSTSATSLPHTAPCLLLLPPPHPHSKTTQTNVKPRIDHE
jgi:hypothetical protein